MPPAAEDFINYCKANPLPKPCRKNLGIKRKNMPQIADESLLNEFKKICKSNRYTIKPVKLKNLHQLNIYTSQKEVNESKAIIMRIKKQYKIPVIMLKKGSEYMIVDGHHRWLAHNIQEQPLDILEIEIPSSQTLENAFYTLDNNMKISGLDFHPQHAISGRKRNKTHRVKKAKKPRRKTKKTPNH